MPSGDHAASQVAKQDHQPGSNWSGKACAPDLYKMLPPTHQFGKATGERTW